MINLNSEAEKEAQILVNYYKTGDFSAAEIKAKKIIKKFPNYLVIYNILGMTLHAQKKFLEAIKYFNKVIQMNPGFVIAINNLGNTYFAIGDLSNAETTFRKVIEIDPKYTPAMNNLGNLKKELNDIDEAIKYYESALKIDEKLPLVHNNLGIALQSVGKFKEANKHILRATELSPNFTLADRNLSNSLKYDINSSHLKNMEKKIKNKSLKDVQKIDLHFSLGKAYEDIKDYKKSFNNYKLGNEIKRNSIKYDINNDKKNFMDIKNSFSKEIFKKFDAKNVQKRKIIFILGMPRSGTTLVEQIISNHNKVYGIGEIRDLTKLVNENFKFPENLNLRSQNFFTELGKNYLKGFDRYKTNSQFITDKTPLNFKWIGLIKLILPESKIVHCTRDSKDNCLSLFKNYFVGELNFSYNLEEVGMYYNLYRNLMEFWKKLLPNFIHDISYEKLVENQEAETKKLLQFCKLDWDKKCITFHNNKKAILTASVAQARKPIYKNSVKSWQNYKDELSNLFKILEN